MMATSTFLTISCVLSYFIGDQPPAQHYSFNRDCYMAAMKSILKDNCEGGTPWSYTNVARCIKYHRHTPSDCKNKQVRDFSTHWLAIWWFVLDHTCQETLTILCF